MKSQDYNIRANVIANIIKTATLMILSFVTFPYVCRVPVFRSNTRIFP